MSLCHVSHCFMQAECVKFYRGMQAECIKNTEFYRGMQEECVTTQGLRGLMQTRYSNRQLRALLKSSYQIIRHEVALHGDIIMSNE